MAKYKISFSKAIAYTTVLFISLVSCTRKNYSHLSEYQFRSQTETPDYSDLNYWAAHPWKKDISDSLPAALQKYPPHDSLADVFFIHPTTLTDYTDQAWNASINDATINSKTDYSTILYQASAFNANTRLFAPRYRQAHIRSFYTSGKAVNSAFETAYQDVKRAFEYYLKYYNNGRPIIIASHSQGTLHAGKLLKEFFENKPLQHQLVCAYIIGMPVATDYFTALKPCEDSLETGCFVSWRTFKANSEEPTFIREETFKSVVINPLTWTRDTLPAPSSLNMGGVLKNFKHVVPHVVSTQIHRNVLWSSKPNVFGKMLYTQTNYHIGDINLFYMNIRQNVSARIHSFLKKNHKP